MQNKKFKVAINSNGTHSDCLLAIIGNSNSGKEPVNLNDLMGYVRCRNAQYPTLVNTIQWDEKADAISLFDKGETEPYITITECTYDELGEVGTPVENDLENVLN